jgi:hypothetical protein
MTKKYRVLFHGPLGNKKAFKVQMARLGAPPESVDRMIRKAPVILKKGLTLGASRLYADAVLEAGGRVEIQEYGHFEESEGINHSISIATFKDFTMCPECGFKQQKGETCLKCGFRLVKTGKMRDSENVA